MSQGLQSVRLIACGSERSITRRGIVVTVAERVQNYWYFSKRYSQVEIVSSLINSMMQDERSLSLPAQMALRSLNEKRALCQSRIGQLNLSGLADCRACQGRCCDSPSDEYFSPIDYWLRKYVDSHECFYSPRMIETPGYYVRRRLELFARVLGSIPARILGRSSKKGFPVAAIRYQRSAKLRSGCQFLDQSGCSLPYADRPIRCVIYACPRMKRGLKQPARSQYSREIDELYHISIATFRILRGEEGRSGFWSGALLSLVP